MPLPFSTITPDWFDRPVLILAGGPSTSYFDPRPLYSKVHALGCNKSGFYFDAPAITSMDRQFVRRYRDALAESVEVGVEVIIALPPNDESHAPIPGATYVERRRGGDTLSLEPGQVFGVHTGFAALNVALLKGARRIAMTGYDMQHINGQTHNHGRYAWTTSRSGRFMHKWAAGMAKAAEQLEKAGIEVVNFEAFEGASKVMAFRKMPLDGLEEWIKQ